MSDTTAKRTVTGYMCTTDWEHELGVSADPSQIFASAQALKFKKRCWPECGIVRVTVTFEELVEEGCL